MSVLRGSYNTLVIRGLLLSRFSHVQLLATPWTAAYQAPPSMGFSRQEYWSGVPLPSPYQRAVRFLFSYSLEHESLYCLNLPFPRF